MMTPIAAEVTIFALARKSLVSVTDLIDWQAGTGGTIASPKRPSKVALWTNSWAAICPVIFWIDLPTGEAAVKALSWLRL